MDLGNKYGKNYNLKILATIQNMIITQKNRFQYTLTINGLPGTC